MAILQPIPDPPHHVIRSANVDMAYTILRDISTHADTALRQTDSDPLRIRFHLSAVIDTAIPVLQALEACAIDEDIPLDWLLNSAELLGRLVLDLKKAQESADGQ